VLIRNTHRLKQPFPPPKKYHSCSSKVSGGYSQILTGTSVASIIQMMTITDLDNHKTASGSPMGRLSLAPPQEGICEEPKECPCREGLNGWWLLRLTVKLFAFLKLMVYFFPFRLTEILKINSIVVTHWMKELKSYKQFFKQRAVMMSVNPSHEKQTH